jgi:hypothetical protein
VLLVNITLHRPLLESFLFWERPLQDLFQTLEASPSGLTSDEAARRLRLYGSNSFVQESRFASLFSFQSTDPVAQNERYGAGLLLVDWRSS